MSKYVKLNEYQQALAILSGSAKPYMKVDKLIKLCAITKDTKFKRLLENSILTYQKYVPVGHINKEKPRTHRESCGFIIFNNNKLKEYIGLRRENCINGN